MILSLIWLLPMLKKLLMSFLPDSLHLLYSWILQIVTRYPIFEKLLVNVFALRWQMVQHIPHLANTHHVAVNVTWIFTKQMGLAIKVGTIRTNQVVLFLKAKNARREIQQDNQRTSTVIGQAM